MPRVLIGKDAVMRVSISLAALLVNVTASKPVSYTHLDVYKRQECGR